MGTQTYGPGTHTFDLTGVTFPLTVEIKSQTASPSETGIIPSLGGEVVTTFPDWEGIPAAAPGNLDGSESLGDGYVLFIAWDEAGDPGHTQIWSSDGSDSFSTTDKLNIQGFMTGAGGNSAFGGGGSGASINFEIPTNWSATNGPIGIFTTSGAGGGIELRTESNGSLFVGNGGNADQVFGGAAGTVAIASELSSWVTYQSDGNAAADADFWAGAGGGGNSYTKLSFSGLNGATSVQLTIPTNSETFGATLSLVDGTHDGEFIYLFPATPADKGTPALGHGGLEFNNWPNGTLLANYMGGAGGSGSIEDASDFSGWTGGGGGGAGTEGNGSDSSGSDAGAGGAPDGTSGESGQTGIVLGAFGGQGGGEAQITFTWTDESAGGSDVNFTSMQTVLLLGL